MIVDIGNFELIANIFARERIKKEIADLISTIQNMIDTTRGIILKSYDPVRSQAEKILNNIMQRFEYIKQIHFQNKYSTVGTDSPEDILTRCHQLVKDLEDISKSIVAQLKGRASEEVVMQRLKAKEIAIKKVEEKRKVGFFEIADLLKWLVIGIGIIYLAPTLTTLLPKRRD